MPRLGVTIIQRRDIRVQTLVDNPLSISRWLATSGIMRATAITIRLLAQVADDGRVYVPTVHWDNLPQGSPMDLYYSPMDVDFPQAEGKYSNA